MRYLYYCNSTFQLLNALNLHWHRKYDDFEKIEDYHGDLMLLNAFSSAEDIFEKIRSEFDDAYFANKVINKGRFHSVKSISRIINPVLFLKDSGIKNPIELRDKYDCIVCTKFSKAPAAVWQLNKKCGVSLYEDGLSTYDDRVDLSPGSLTYKVLYKWFNHGRTFYGFDYLYLNTPKLYEGKYINKLVENPKYNTDYLKRIRELLCTSILKEDKDLYWLGQYYKNDVNKETLNSLKGYEERIIYRPHPRYPQQLTDIEISKDRSIWELKILDIGNLSNKCFLTINSNAVFSPKILYGEEPYIIFTDKIVDNGNGSYLNLIEKFKKTYNEPSKIMVPANEKELRESVESFFRYVKNK